MPLSKAEPPSNTFLRDIITQLGVSKTVLITQYSAGLFHAKGFNTDITQDHIICSVDKAMYQAKESGRNQTIEEMAACV